MPNAKEVLEYMEWKEGRVQTNEEWFCGLSTEEKAEQLYRWQEQGNTILRKFKSEWVRWLKEMHRESE